MGAEPCVRVPTVPTLLTSVQHLALLYCAMQEEANLGRDVVGRRAALVGRRGPLAHANVGIGRHWEGQRGTDHDDAGLALGTACCEAQR